MKLHQEFRPSILLSETHFPFLGQDGVFADAIRRVVDEGFFQNVEIAIRPVRVQGDKAAKEIAEAIEELNEYNHYIEKEKKEENPIDVIIAGRGGGS